MISEGLLLLFTGVKADENSDLHHWNKLQFLFFFITNLCI